MVPESSSTPTADKLGVIRADDRKDFGSKRTGGRRESFIEDGTRSFL